MRSALAAGLVLAAVLATGCGPTRGPAVGSLPLCSPDSLLAVHNAWADSIHHVWSRARLTVVMPKEGDAGERVQYDMDGHLFIRKPDDLLLQGEVVGQDVVKIGMNAERFWLWIRPQVNTVWTARRGGPGERRFILSVSDLMTALGLFRIDLARDAMAGFERQPQACVLTESRRIAGADVPWRRTWFDRASGRPIRVDLYDESDKCILMAELLRYESVGGTNVCTVYRARFYGDQEVDLVLQLSDVRLDKPPNPLLFKYVVPPDAEVKDLDEGA